MRRLCNVCVVGLMGGDSLKNFNLKTNVDPPVMNMLRMSVGRLVETEEGERPVDGESQSMTGLRVTRRNEKDSLGGRMDAMGAAIERMATAFDRGRLGNRWKTGCTPALSSVAVLQLLLNFVKRQLR
eukprot:GHVS01011377.1.p2 GENE.GHVS01011377.1~~GHVS01011377.1.p2  ORF type:complete len:127 (-),score=14.96 GHVS01011377.1:121-501(-)